MRIWPLPAALKRGGWTLLEGEEEKTSIRQRKIVIPTGTDETSARLRDHAMAHVEWSPEKWESLSQVACEDGRINFLLRDLDIASIDMSPQQLSAEGVSARTLALCWACGLGLKSETAWRDALRSGILPERAWKVDRLAQALEELRANYRDPRAALAAARVLDKLFPPTLRDAEEPAACILTRPGSGTLHGEKSDWLPMEMQEPERTVDKSHLAWKRVYRATDMGTRIGRLERLLTDGMVFHKRARKKTAGGAFLLDASGSMTLSSQDIQNILDVAPAATVAMYCSNYERSNYEYGVLTILAKDGRAVANIPKRVGGGNGVDGPALQWLAKQDRPRFWYSDGGVTGSNDMHHPDLLQECKETCRLGGITWIDTRVQKLDVWLQEECNGAS